MTINTTSKFDMCEEIYKELITHGNKPSQEEKDIVTEAFVTHSECTEGTALVYFSMIMNRVLKPETALRKPLTRNRSKYNNLDKYDTDYDSASAMVDEAFR